MSKMAIKVEFLPGTNIEEAIYEAVELAEKLNVAYVKFLFNTVIVTVSPSLRASKATLRTLYDKALEQKHKYLLLSGDLE